MIARSDLIVALAASALTAAVAAFALQPKTFLGSSIYDWNSIPAKQTDIGEIRSFFRGPTATLDELEVHVIKLNPGQASHPPHKHPNGELVIVKEGTVETCIDAKWTRVGPGSVVFSASNQLQGVRNSGAVPAAYHVVNWSAPGMLAKPQ